MLEGRRSTEILSDNQVEFRIDFLDGYGPGRGKPDANGGAGHGGQGGLLFENKKNFIFGDIYGVKYGVRLIGGSAGK